MTARPADGPARRDAASSTSREVWLLMSDLESLGLVRRRPHPTDRRAKLVEATRKGKDMARRADAILGTPPAALSALSTDDLQALRRILKSITAQR